MLFFPSILEVIRSILFVFSFSWNCLFINLIINFSSGCGGQMTGDGGNFTSPNYPESYSKNSECVWTIVVPLQDTIELTFHEFHLENSGSCNYDFVEVRQGSTRFSEIIGKFCASTIISPFNSTGDSLFIRLVTDGTVNEKGFRATWRRISHYIPANQTAQSSTTTKATPSIAPPESKQYFLLFSRFLIFTELEINCR